MNVGSHSISSDGGGMCVYTPGEGLTDTVTDTYLLTYLLTPWNRVLLETLTGSQLVKKFSAFYGARMCTTAFTNARHLPLS